MTTFRYSPRWQEMTELLERDPGGFYALMEDRERQLEAFLNFGPETYTPTLIGSGGVNPNLGAAGYSAGIFTATGRQISGVFEFAFAGAGIAAGTGGYNVTLPLPITHFVAAAGGVISQFGGSIDVFDNSAGSHFFGKLELSAAIGDDVGRLITVGGSASPTNPWGGGPAVSDQITGDFHFWIDG